MAVRIGLPQGLLHYQYGSIWENFFINLGTEVILSGSTTKATLDYGSVLDEVCLPAKIYFGHVCKLYKEVDYLFSPRLVSVSAEQYTCPKIIGMPDLLRSNIRDLPPIIDVNVNLRHNQYDLYQAIISVGRLLGRGAIPSLHAWYCAWKGQQQRRIAKDCTTDQQRIGLIGHPYIISDCQISMNIVNKLRGLGFAVVSPEDVGYQQAAIAVKDWKKIFWSSSQHMAGAALTLMQSSKPIDGIIFITSFSCGPDTLIGELVSRRAQSLNIPFMLLTIDEHTAEAGFITRLEAFTDMLSRRKRA